MMNGWYEQMSLSGLQCNEGCVADEGGQLI